MMSLSATVCLVVCALVCLRVCPSLAQPQPGLVCYETKDIFSSLIKSNCAACLINTISVFGTSETLLSCAATTSDFVEGCTPYGSCTSACYTDCCNGPSGCNVPTTRRPGATTSVQAWWNPGYLTTTRGTVRATTGFNYIIVGPGRGNVGTGINGLLGLLGIGNDAARVEVTALASLAALSILVVIIL